MVRHLLLAAALSWSVEAFAQQSPPADQSASAGRDVFMKVGCWTCHGTEGQGAARSGPAIAATALPYEAFLRQLRRPINQMIPVPTSIVSDEQATDIYAFLHTLKRPDWKTIPLLNP